MDWPSKLGCSCKEQPSLRNTGWSPLRDKSPHPCLDRSSNTWLNPGTSVLADPHSIVVPNNACLASLQKLHPLLQLSSLCHRCSPLAPCGSQLTLQLVALLLKAAVLGSGLLPCSHQLCGGSLRGCCACGLHLLVRGPQPLGCGKGCLS